VTIFCGWTTWSETATASKPAASAARARAMSWSGGVKASEQTKRSGDSFGARRRIL
jgi:hypothetical protein